MTEHFLTEFTTNFHNLQGSTVGEKKIKLYELFNNATILQTNSVLLEQVTSQLRPETHLEDLFFVEFLIHFHKCEELIDEFLKGNNYVIKRVVNQTWFLKSLFRESGSEFVTQVIPTLSYNLTVKVLKKIELIINEAQADEIFDGVLEIYGLHIAVKMLTCCSSDKIKHILESHAVKLSLSQLKSLYHKNPNLVYIYLKEIEKHTGNKNCNDFNPIFNYIAQKDLDMYQDLCLNYDFKTKLGKRTTRKFVKAKRQDIIANPEHYVKHLHPKHLIKLLGSDFQDVYFKLFPRKIEDSPKAETSRLLKYYPKKEQYTLMLTTYNKIFAKKLDECPHLIDEYILEMMYDPDERERLAKIFISRKNLMRLEEDAYLKYYRPDHCLDIVKQKINFAREPYERNRLLVPIIDSCFINRDYDALLIVAKFVTERFKNDHIDVQSNFLTTLISRNCNFNKLHEGHWEEIKKITCRSDFVVNAYNITPIEIFYQYVDFLIRSGKSVKNEVMSFFKKVAFTADSLQYIRSIGDQKVLFLNLIELAPNLTAVTTIEKLDCEILLACEKYNSKHPKTPINVFEFTRLLQSVKNILTEKLAIEDSKMFSVLQFLLCTKNNTEELEELRKLFWKNTKYATPVLMKWFVKYRPDMIQKNVIAFMEFSKKNSELSKDRKTWNYIKCYRHLKIDTKAIKFCISNLTPQTCEILSHLMSKEEFLSLMDSHKPCQIGDALIEQDTTRFSLQIALLKSLKNVQPTVATLSVMMKFCVGDYLPLCLNPLYGVFHKMPKNSINNFVEELKNHTSLCLQNLSYNIICLIHDKDTVLANLKQCQLDKAVTITFKYFLKNPSTDSWEIFMNKLHTLQALDPNTSKLIATKHVPKKYKAQHFENVWTVLYRNDNKRRFTLMKNVQTETVLQLKSEFLENIINKELFSGEEINKIISIYLIASDAENKINIIQNSLQNYKKSSKFSMQQIHKFVQTLFITYMELNTSVESIVEPLLTMFQKTFPAVEIFQEYVTITLMKCKNQNLHDVTTSVIQLHRNLVATYGETITGIFADMFEKLLPHFNPQLQFYEFLDLLMTYQKSAADVLLVVKLLPADSEPEDVDNVKHYDHVLSELQQQHLPSVQVHLNLFFKRHKLATNVSYYTSVGGFCVSDSSWLAFGARKRIGYYYY